MSKIKYKGGTAIMLKFTGEYVEPLESLRDQIRNSENAGAWRITPPEEYHLTLQFVGRDLTSEKVSRVVFSTYVFAEDEQPFKIEFTGAVRVNRTSKGSYVVAEVLKSKDLLRMKERIVDKLAQMEIKPRDGFDFNPHVTLAEAAPGQSAPSKVANIQPFTVDCKEIVVKYGSERRLSIDL